MVIQVAQDVPGLSVFQVVVKYKLEQLSVSPVMTHPSSSIKDCLSAVALQYSRLAALRVTPGSFKE